MSRTARHCAGPDFPSAISGTLRRWRGSSTCRTASLRRPTCGRIRPTTARRDNMEEGEEMKAASVMIGAVAATLATGALAQTPQLVSEDLMVPSDAGIEIFVRNKRPAALTTFRPERTVVYVHGATYPASTSFDLKLDGLSWMDYIAARGYDVYLLDVRGYGRSTRPPEMAQDAKASPAIVRGDIAVKDIAAVV